MGRVLEESQVQDMKNIRNKQGKGVEHGTRGGFIDNSTTLIRLKETSLFLVKQLHNVYSICVFKCRI